MLRALPRIVALCPTCPALACGQNPAQSLRTESAVLVLTFRCGIICVRGGTGASRRSAADDPMVVPNHRCGSARLPGLLCSCLLASACSLSLSTSGRQISLNCPFDGLFLLPFVVLSDLGTQLYRPVTRAALFTPLRRGGLHWCPPRRGCPCNGHRVGRNCVGGNYRRAHLHATPTSPRGSDPQASVIPRAEARFRLIVSLVKLGLRVIPLT